jgi:branched-subunit amino acid transport protein AzlD
MIRFKLLMTALLTILVGYCLTNLLVLPVSFGKFLLIEVVIVVTHSSYNYVKKDCLTN